MPDELLLHKSVDIIAGIFEQLLYIAILKNFWYTVIEVNEMEKEYGDSCLFCSSWTIFEVALFHLICIINFGTAPTDLTPGQKALNYDNSSSHDDGTWSVCGIKPCNECNFPSVRYKRRGSRALSPSIIVTTKKMNELHAKDNRRQRRTSRHNTREDRSRDREDRERAALKIGIRMTYSRYVTISEMGTSRTTPTSPPRLRSALWMNGRRRTCVRQERYARPEGICAISHGKLNGRVSAHKPKNYDDRSAFWGNVICYHEERRTAVL